MSRKAVLIVLLAVSMALGGIGVLVALGVLAPRVRTRMSRRRAEGHMSGPALGVAAHMEEPAAVLAVPARAHGVRPAWVAPILTGLPD